MARCNGCKDCRKVTAADGFTFLGCFHNPFRGKWVAEIKDCPKANVPDTEKAVTPESSAWIPVEEGLPKTGDTYLVSGLIGYSNENPKRFVDAASSFGDDIDGFWDTWHDWDEGQSGNGVLTITHWMPLPEPPKGGASE